VARTGAEHLDRPPVRSEEAEEEGDGGRLSGPVGSEESDGFATGNLKAQMVEGNMLSVAAYDVIEAQRRIPTVRPRPDR